MTTRDMPFPAHAEAALSHGFRKPLPPRVSHHITPKESWETRCYRVHVVLSRNMASDCTVKMSQTDLAREAHVNIQYIKKCLKELEDRRVIRRLNTVYPAIYRVSIAASL